MESYIFRITAVAAAVACLAGCGRRTPDFDACGQIDAVEVTVSAEGSGRILSLDVEEGDYLPAGRCIGYIDTVQLSLQRDELLRRRESARVKTVDIACQTRAQYARLDNLGTELGRARDLLSKDAGTQKQVDDMESEIEILKAQIAAAEQNYRQNNESILCEINTIDVQIAQMEDKLDKCRICPPIDGTVLTRYVEAGESVTSGKPLFTMADMDHVFVRAYFSSAALAGLHVGDRVRVIPDDGTPSPREYSGTVTWISSEAEFTPKNIQTRDERADLVYAVKIAVEGGNRLRLGMYAYVLID